MNLAAPAALQNLRALVLRDHALNLHQQFVFGGLTCRPVKKDSRHAVPSELVEQQHLIGILASKSIGAVHIEDLDGPFRCAITKALKRGAHECRTTEAVIHVDIVRQHDVAIGLRSLLQRCDLTLDRRLLRLLFRRDACVQRDRFHRGPPRCRRATSATRRSRSRVATSSSLVTTRSMIGVTTPYTARRWSADKRVGENATRITSPRRMEDDTQHDSVARSRNRRTVRRASRSSPAVERPAAENLATYAAAPLEVCDCVSGATTPPCGVERASWAVYLTARATADYVPAR